MSKNGRIPTLPLTGDAGRLLVPVLSLLLLTASLATTLLLGLTKPLDEDELRFLQQGSQYARGDAVYEAFVAFPSAPTAALASWAFRVGEGPADAIQLNRLLMLLIHVANAFLIFQVGRRIFGGRAGLYAAAAWCSFGFVVIKGAELRSVHGALLFILAGLLIYVRAWTERRQTTFVFLLEGALAATALLMKADSIAIFGILWLADAWHVQRLRVAGMLQTGLLFLGGFLSVGVLYLWSLGTLPRIAAFLFVHYHLVFLIQTLGETAWDPASVFRLSWALPLGLLTLASLPPALAAASGRRRFLVVLLLVYAAVQMLQLSVRHIFYQQNLLYPALVPALLVGNLLAWLDRRPRGLALAVAALLLLAVSGWHAVRVHAFEPARRFRAENERRFAPLLERSASDGRIALADLAAVVSGARTEWLVPFYRLTLPEQRALSARIAGLCGPEGWWAFDAFGAFFPARGAERYGGMTLSSFHEDKLQLLYDHFRSEPSPLHRLLSLPQPVLFHSMEPDSVEDALVAELVSHPPALYVLDGWVLRLVLDHPPLRRSLERGFDIRLVPEAHSILALRKGAFTLTGDPT